MSDDAHPLRDLDGPVAVVVPHMDDEAIGCGIALASRPRHNPVHVYFAGDGLGSFTPAFVQAKGVDALRTIRRAEGMAALTALGLPDAPTEFGDFQEWVYDRAEDRLTASVGAWLDRVKPVAVLYPFRLDSHPDHLAVHRAVRVWLSQNERAAAWEYFVYYRKRLLPGGDMRDMVRDGFLRTLRPGPHAAAKEAALNAYVSQATLYDPAWVKPVLSPAFIAEIANDRECFFDAGAAGREGGWLRHAAWTRLVHWAEPRLKRLKDRVAARKG